jgi:hypothetical protein
VQVIIVLLVGLHFVDSLPLHLALLCIFSHLVYLQNFSRTWPSISLTSPAFIASCVLVIASHFVAFSHFSLRARGGSNSHGYNYGNGGGGTWGKQGRHGGWKNGRRLDEDSFMDVATFFGVCVWLVPFYLFLSLSANDNVLPSSGGSLSTLNLNETDEEMQVNHRPRQQQPPPTLHPHPPTRPSSNPFSRPASPSSPPSVEDHEEPTSGTDSSLSPPLPPPPPVHSAPNLDSHSTLSPPPSAITHPPTLPAVYQTTDPQEVLKEDSTPTEVRVDEWEDQAGATLLHPFHLLLQASTLQHWGVPIH